MRLPKGSVYLNYPSFACMSVAGIAWSDAYEHGLSGAEYALPLLVSRVATICLALCKGETEQATRKELRYVLANLAAGYREGAKTRAQRCEVL